MAARAKEQFQRGHEMESKAVKKMEEKGKKRPAQKPPMKHAGRGR